MAEALRATIFPEAGLVFTIIVAAMFAAGRVAPLARIQPRSQSVPRWSGPSTRRSVLKIAGTLHRWLYWWSGGLVGTRLRGCPVLLLTTTGRKTGQERTWPLCYVDAGDALVLVASAGGQPRHPAWYLNLRANPRVSIQRGDSMRTMVARPAEGIERAHLWDRIVQQFPVCARYQRQTRREIPVVVLHPATPWMGDREGAGHA